jgi:hypothetical protein
LFIVFTAKLSDHADTKTDRSQSGVSFRRSSFFRILSQGASISAAELVIVTRDLVVKK